MEFKHLVLGKKLKLSQGIFVCHYCSCLCASWVLIHFRIREAERDRVDVVDVDGSYVYRKYQNMVSSGITVSDPGVPAIPLTGWEQITELNYKEMAKKIPKVTHGE